MSRMSVPTLHAKRVGLLALPSEQHLDVRHPVTTQLCVRRQRIRERAVPTPAHPHVTPLCVSKRASGSLNSPTSPRQPYTNIRVRAASAARSHSGRIFTYSHL